jgi:hypothetical protein
VKPVDLTTRFFLPSPHSAAISVSFEPLFIPMLLPLRAAQIIALSHDKLMRPSVIGSAQGGSGMIYVIITTAWAPTPQKYDYILPSSRYAKIMRFKKII